MTDRSGGMWGGRFEGATDALFREFNDSLSVDHVLVQYDITGSIAWADALMHAGVITAEECARLKGGLEQVAEHAQATDFFAADDEDIHGWVERELIARVGDLGKKLHTGRSRNDQVATDLRLWARDAVTHLTREIRSVQRALVELADREKHTIMPGYTHLQRAQPILFAHWCLAYVEMLDRDVKRVEDARKRADECPLGSAALAGASFPIDRAAIARSLGFSRPTLNSLDAVSDRDLVFDLLAAASLCMVHLSRLAEDVICYTSGEFGFIELGDHVTSGSSIMPQKKNPDALELIRGKTGTVCGALSGFLMTMKATPLAYNKDFQEDKPTLFRTLRELSICLRMAERVIDSARANSDTCRTAAEGGHANATALANYLVDKGVPFREAHEVTGRLVLAAIKAGTTLQELPLETLRAANSAIADDVFDCLKLETTLQACDVLGGTAPQRVHAAIDEARRRLATDSTS